MDEAKFLIVGAGGQLGRALAEQYPKARRVDVAELDITDRDAVLGYDWRDVEIILNAAAYTNVDGAETPEGRIAAWQANAQAVGHLAEVAREHDITLVHISTDYVFDGTRNPHTEDELFSPLSVYGASKAAGDIAASLNPKHYILRTSWVIGNGKNFVRTMLELGQKGVDPAVVADQIGRPTFTSQLVTAIDHLLTTKSEFGTYNVSNDGRPVSWADLTRAIFEDAGFKAQVTDTTTAEYYQHKTPVAPRPACSTFDLTKIKATGFEPVDWRLDLEKYIKQELGR